MEQPVVAYGNETVSLKQITAEKIKLDYLHGKLKIDNIGYYVQDLPNNYVRGLLKGYCTKKKKTIIDEAYIDVLTKECRKRKIKLV